MSTDLLTHLKFYFSGSVLAFYVVSLAQLMPAFVNAKSNISRHVQGFLICSLVVLGLRYIITIFNDLNIFTTVPEVHDHIQRCTWYLEMLVIPFMGLSMLTIVRLKIPRMWIFGLVILPYVVALIAYAITASTIAMDFAMYYSVVYAAIVTFGVFTHAARYQKVLNETYADTSHRGVTWVVVTHIILLGLVTLWFVTRFFFNGLISKVFYIPLSIIPWIIYKRRILRQNYNMDAMVGLISGDSLLPKTDEEDQADLKTWQEQGFGQAIDEYCHDVVHFTNPDLSIVDVAQAIGSNRTYVSRWFKEQGKTFSSYITDIRIEYAQSLLVYSSYSITEVVKMSGFSSVRTFRAQFVARFSCTPSDYRGLHNLHHPNVQ